MSTKSVGVYHYVSLNCPIDDAIKEQNEYAELGYLAVGSYGNDYDMGIIMKNASGSSHKEVLKEHIEYTKQVKERRKLIKEKRLNNLRKY